MHSLGWSDDDIQRALRGSDELVTSHGRVRLGDLLYPGGEGAGASSGNEKSMPKKDTTKVQPLDDISVRSDAEASQSRVPQTRSSSTMVGGLLAKQRLQQTKQGANAKKPAEIKPQTTETMSTDFLRTTTVSAPKGGNNDHDALRSLKERLSNSTSKHDRDTQSANIASSSTRSSSGTVGQTIGLREAFNHKDTAAVRLPAVQSRAALAHSFRRIECYYL